MKRENRGPYLAMGLTAFAVIAASLLLFFMLFHMKEVTGFLSTLGVILRPIFMGAVIAFLLLPVHRAILRFLMAMTTDKRKADHRNVAFLNFIAIILSLLLALFLIYLLMAMVFPQVYASIVGLVQSIPDYIEVVQVWLQTFFEDNPDIQSAVMSVYTSSAASLEQWLNSDILPNLESVSTTFQWMRTTIWPNFTGMMAGVSGVLLGFLGIFLCIEVFPYLEEFALARSRNMNLYVELGGLEQVRDFVALMKGMGIQIYDMELERRQSSEERDRISVVFYLHLPKYQSHTKLLTQLAYSPDVKAVDEI